METLLKLLTDSFSVILTSPSWLLLLLVLNLIGAYLQWANWCDNRIVPAILVVLGSALYFFLGEMGAVSASQRYPGVVLIMIGFIIGAVAYGLHFTVVAAWRQKFAVKNQSQNPLRDADDRVKPS